MRPYSKHLAAIGTLTYSEVHNVKGADRYK